MSDIFVDNMNAFSLYQPMLLHSGIVFALVLLILVTCVFLFAQYKSDNSIMDIVYGPLFTVAGLTTLILSGNITPLSLLVMSSVGLWSLRLGVRIWRKNHGQPEDPRYAAWRVLWKERGDWYFVIRSYLQINLLQGIIIGFVSAPIILSIAFGQTVTLTFSSYLVWLGVFVFAFGLAYESVADYQLDQFIARKKAGTESATLMQTGLFRYSRRPNYFGETLVWWGLAIMVMPLPYGYLGLISPLLITFIVTKVTGPMLEAIFLKREPEAYQAYIASTSYFIPLPPKK